VFWLVFVPHTTPNTFFFKQWSKVACISADPPWGRIWILNTYIALFLPLPPNRRGHLPPGSNLRSSVLLRRSGAAWVKRSLMFECYLSKINFQNPRDLYKMYHLWKPPYSILLYHKPHTCIPIRQESCGCLMYWIWISRENSGGNATHREAPRAMHAGYICISPQKGIFQCCPIEVIILNSIPRQELTQYVRIGSG